MPGLFVAVYKHAYGGSSNNETWHIHFIYHDKSLSKQKLQVCKQQQTALGNKKIANDICAYNLHIVGPLTMNLGTLISHDESSLKHKLQVCKQ